MTNQRFFKILSFAELKKVVIRKAKTLAKTN